VATVEGHSVPSARRWAKRWELTAEADHEKRGEHVIERVKLVRAGAVCAVVGVAGFVLGIALMAASGVQVLIPPTGKDGLDWIADVQDGGDLFIAGATIVVFAGLFFLVAVLGFYDALRDASALMIIAPVAGAAGMVLVTISHATPIAIALELAPAYEAANDATQGSLAVSVDLWARFSLLMNYFGDILIWGVTTPLFAWAVLKSQWLPRWVGWIGIVAAVFAGWLGLLSPLSSVIDGLSAIGFLTFFIFMASLGVALIRRTAPDALGVPPVTAATS
jgi:hypothetical protein